MYLQLKHAHSMRYPEFIYANYIGLTPFHKREYYKTGAVTKISMDQFGGVKKQTK